MADEASTNHASQEPLPIAAVLVAVTALDTQIALIEAGLEAQRLAWERAQAAQRAHLACLKQARAELHPMAGSQSTWAGQGANGSSVGTGLGSLRSGHFERAGGTGEDNGRAGGPRRPNTARILEHMRKVGPMVNADLYASLQAAGIAPSSQNALSSLLRRLSDAGLVESDNKRPRYNMWKATQEQPPSTV